ncbi:hypothetical protein [Mycobacterium sp. AT1]|nr:hypothetical protein [Mycobacterium sp. AT1]
MITAAFRVAEADVDRLRRALGEGDGWFTDGAVAGALTITAGSPL